MTQEANSERQPITIRAHRLRLLIPLIEENRGKSRGYVESVATKRAELMVADICLTSNIPYIEDALGTSKEEMTAFKSNFKSFLVNILSADDDQPITLVEGQRDDVCKGCATGNHCESTKEDRLIGYYFRRFSGDVVETTAKELRECVSEHLQWRRRY